MKTVMRPRYYCDHCNKGSGSPSAMRRHERGCTANPNRVCGMCALQADDGGAEPAPHRDELVRILDSSGFTEMCSAANGCPACILAAIRTKNYFDEERGPIVLGPNDGRQEWQYKVAKQLWWDGWQSAAAERESYL